MTWGSHCSNCGKDDCLWADGIVCEGRVRDQRPGLQLTPRWLRWLGYKTYRRWEGDVNVGGDFRKWVYYD